MNTIFPSKQTGFTLIEMVLSICMIAILSTVSLSVYMSYQKTNDLENTTVSIVHSLRRAQFLAMKKTHNDDWGVSINSDSTTLFRGNNYTTREAAYDEIYKIPLSVIISGAPPFNYIFTKGTGIPTTTGSVDVADNEGLMSFTISLNEQGIISY